MRSDLPEGVQLAQAAHAAQEALGHPPTVMRVLAVPDEASLKQLVAAFKDAGIAQAPVVEDAGPLKDQLVSIGLAPVDDAQPIRELTGNLRAAGRRR